MVRALSAMAREDRLANPPGGIGGRLVSPPPFNCRRPASVRYFSSPENRSRGIQAAIGIFLGDGNNQASRFGQFFGLFRFGFPTMDQGQRALQALCPHFARFGDLFCACPTSAELLACFDCRLAVRCIRTPLQAGASAFESMQALDRVPEKIDQAFLFGHAPKINGTDQQRNRYWYAPVPGPWPAA